MPHKDPLARKEYLKNWRFKNPRYSTEIGWVRRGMPAPTRDMPATCEICGIGEVVQTKNFTQKGLALDRCHQTGRFRGWLCSRCNLGLGRYGDDPGLISMAMLYLATDGNMQLITQEQIRTIGNIINSLDRQAKDLIKND